MPAFLFSLVRYFLSHKTRKQTEELYLMYHPLLRRRCWKLLRDETLVEDAMQEVFWTICRHLEQYQGEPDKILPWLYRITTTRCFKLLEKNQRWERNMELAFAQGAARYDNNLAPAEIEASLSAHALLERLPPRQREAIVYRHVSGMTQQEIAEVMGVTRDQVRTWLKQFQQRAASWRQSMETEA